MNKITIRLLSFLSGVANGLFGSGGGILAVEAMKQKKLSQKTAQATALCSTVFMSLFSVTYYLYKGYFNLSDALIYIPFGIPGALAGSFLLEKLPDKHLKRIFAIIIIVMAVRILLK